VSGFKGLLQLGGKPAHGHMGLAMGVWGFRKDTFFSSAGSEEVGFPRGLHKETIEG